jgi:hypothetical protein
MRYKIKVIADDDKTDKTNYTVDIKNFSYPNVKAVAEKIIVSIEENIHPIMIEIMDNDGINSYSLYFTRKLAKALLRKLIPCDKSGIELLIIKGVDWDG